MTKGDLDGVTFLGRPIKPVALGIALIMLAYTVFNILDIGVLAGLGLITDSTS